MLSISGRKLRSSQVAASQLGNYDGLFELESGGNDSFAELREVVLVDVADLLDQPVHAKPL
jgi:hypothetical protein